MINVEIAGIRMCDSPDFSDAYISYAEHEDGTPYSDMELDTIPSDVVYEAVMSWLY